MACFTLFDRTDNNGEFVFFFPIEEELPLYNDEWKDGDVEWVEGLKCEDFLFNGFLVFNVGSELKVKEDC